MSVPSPPSPEQGFRIHRDLCAGVAVAPTELCEAYLEHLLGWLARVAPRADPHSRTEAAERALLSLIERPESFDPGQGELGAFLRQAARCDLLNLLESEKRHHRRRVPLDVVALAADGRNKGRAEAWAAEEAAELAALLTEEERAVWALMCAGERSTAAFAAVLGLADRPEWEQAREVKRVKDRIVKRLRRKGGGRERSA
jgi:hypothetical protein